MELFLLISDRKFTSAFNQDPMYSRGDGSRCGLLDFDTCNLMDTNFSKKFTTSVVKANASSILFSETLVSTNHNTQCCNSENHNVNS
jgi:hypothetical protein